MLRNFMTHEECDKLVAGVDDLVGNDKFQFSTTGGKRGTGGDGKNRVRTSSNAFDGDSI